MKSHRNSLISWAIWALLYALALSGKPWHFPEQGKLWMQSVFPMHSKS